MCLLKSHNKSLNLKTLTAAVLQDVIESDAAMQVHQLRVWREVAKTDPFVYLIGSGTPGGYDTGPPVEFPDLVEGIDRHNNLMLGGVTLRLTIEEVRPSWWVRVFSFLLGKAAPSPRYRLARSPSSGGVITVEVRVGRSVNGGWDIKTEPQLEREEQGMVVENISGLI